MYQTFLKGLWPLFLVLLVSVLGCANGKPSPGGKAVEPVWRIDDAIPPSSAEQVYTILEDAAQQRLYLADGFNGHLLAVTVQGEQLWAYDWEDSFASIELQGNQLVVWSVQGFNRRLDAQSGAVIAEQALPTWGEGVEALAAQQATRYAFDQNRSSLLAVDARTNQPLWESAVTLPDGKAVEAKPVIPATLRIAGDQLFLTIGVATADNSSSSETTTSYLWVFQAKDGKLQWQKSHSGMYYYGDVLVYDQYLLMSYAYMVKTDANSETVQNELHRLDPATGNEIWQQTGSRGIVGTRFVLDGQLYYHIYQDQVNEFRVLDWKDGKVLQTFSSPCSEFIADGVNYCALMQSTNHYFDDDWYWHFHIISDGWVEARQLASQQPIWSSPITPQQVYVLIGLSKTLVLSEHEGDLVAFAR